MRRSILQYVRIVANLKIARILDKFSAGRNQWRYKEASPDETATPADIFICGGCSEEGSFGVPGNGY